mmetsp:Transcript_31302/g.28476  ORF Transcript_31302/g.28476 Transcript_31302/m.28476 type:complete len:134 (+) Transcript_31302:807-1208(+)
MDIDYNADTQIIFMTNGVFLQRFIHEDESTRGGIIDNFTHVILDEVHERDIDSDFIMVALKHILSKHPKFKLILMSATINAKLFSEYFSREQIEACASFKYNYIINQAKKNSTWDGPLKWDDGSLYKDKRYNP